MTKAKGKKILKNLTVDLTMLMLFVLLLGFSFWLVWMYFFRGPIDMETRGYVSKTLKEMVVQPSDTERYTLQHFHNLNDVVLKGIEYPSTCVTCHGDYSHDKTPKVRAFYNAHSWFMACEVCHRENENEKSVIYKWLDNDTDIALYKLQGERGIYGARIVPLILENETERRLDNLIDEKMVIAYKAKKDSLDETQDKAAMDKMHQVLSKKPVACDQCHTETNGLFEFKDLLYSNNMAEHLKSIDVGAMINGYKIFYIPNVLGTKD